MLIAGCGGDDEKPAASATAEPVTTPLTTQAESATTTPAETGTTTRADADEDEDETRTERESGAGEDEGTARTNRRRATSRSRSGSGDRKRQSTSRRRTQPDARARFIARGDAICADYRRQESEARKQNTGEKEEQVRYLSTVASLVSESVERLKALGAAPGDKGKFDAYVAKLEELAGHVRRFRDAIANDDRSYAQEARRVSETSAEARRIAREYGFQVCGSE